MFTLVFRGYWSAIANFVDLIKLFWVPFGISIFLGIARFILAARPATAEANLSSSYPPPLMLTFNIIVIVAFLILFFLFSSSSAVGWHRLLVNGVRPAVFSFLPRDRAVIYLVWYLTFVFVYMLGASVVTPLAIIAVGNRPHLRLEAIDWSRNIFNVVLLFSGCRYLLVLPRLSVSTQHKWLSHVSNLPAISFKVRAALVLVYLVPLLPMMCQWIFAPNGFDFPVYWIAAGLDVALGIWSSVAALSILSYTYKSSLELD